MRNKAAVIFITFCFLLLSESVPAHHSLSVYDLGHPITLKGTVTAFEWANPHVQVYFDVKDDKGHVVKWSAEAASPRLMEGSVLKKDSLKPGDSIVIVGNRAKDCSPTMHLLKLTLPNGQVFDGYYPPISNRSEIKCP
jgi:hypothetical protein